MSCLAAGDGAAVALLQRGVVRTFRKIKQETLQRKKKSLFVIESLNFYYCAQPR